jgi:hypothetical protein
MADQAMIPVRSDLVRQTSQYVEAAQGLISKQAETEAAIKQAAPGVVDALVRQGLVHEHLKEATVREFCESPAKAVEFLGKVAEKMEVPSLGNIGPRELTVPDGEVKQGSADQVFLATLTGGN